MTDNQRFMGADGVPLPYLQTNESGSVVIPPDSFSAIRAVMAALDTDDTTMLEVLQDRPALPLVAGLISLVILFGEQSYGYALRDRLDVLALVSTDEVADSFREQQRSRS